jgi:hypothetical protein
MHRIKRKLGLWSTHDGGPGLVFASSWSAIARNHVDHQWRSHIPTAFHTYSPLSAVASISLDGFKGCSHYWRVLRLAIRYTLHIDPKNLYLSTPGIGQATAIALSTAGWKIVLTARRLGELQETSKRCPNETLVLAGDIIDEPFVKGIFDTAVAHFGRLPYHDRLLAQ